jgi:hypothetical protein
LVLVRHLQLHLKLDHILDCILWRLVQHDELLDDFVVFLLFLSILFGELLYLFFEDFELFVGGSGGFGQHRLSWVNL